MTQKNNLAITLTSRSAISGAIPGKNLYLQQTGLPPSSINLIDIYHMWASALSGTPAQKYKNSDCPISFEGGTAHVWFDFYVFPIPGQLVFNLNASLGVIGTPKIVQVAKSHDVIFKYEKSVDLEYTPITASAKWQTRCYLQNRDTLSSQQLILKDNILSVKRACFGVARIVAQAHAYRYRLAIEILKADNRVTLTPPIITASWQTATGKTTVKQLELAVPKCVEFGLGLCDGDLGDTICQPNGYNVYYSVCDGSVLGTRREDNQRWCGKGEIGYAN